MQRYIIRRILQGILVLFGVSIIVFMLARVSGDPLDLMMPPEATEADREGMRHKLRLDRPIYAQYWTFITGAIQGDFGQSFKWEESVRNLIFARLPNSLQLAGLALAVALLVGITVGILSAFKPDGFFDSFGKVFALLGQATPTFWVALMMILLFSVTWRLLPTSGIGGPQHLLMPGIALGWYATAAITRLTRSSMLDVLDSEYIKMARIKGVPERMVLLKHALKNASIPLLTMASLQFIALISGAVIVETVFAWPGVGSLLIDAVYARDYPVAQAITLMVSAMFVFANLAVDILYAYLDPRIRYG